MPAAAAIRLAATITNSPTLANGLFSVNLDFGTGAFNGSARWLDITVTNGATTQTLSPRVQVLPAPYAQFAAIAGTVTNGAIMNAQLATNAVATMLSSSRLFSSDLLDDCGENEDEYGAGCWTGNATELLRRLDIGRSSFRASTSQVGPRAPGHSGGGSPSVSTSAPGSRHYGRVPPTRAAVDLHPANGARHGLTGSVFYSR